MEKGLPICWVKNARDALHLAWVLSHVEPPLPMELRLLMLRYMCDAVRDADATFNQLATWSGTQRRVYEALLKHDMSVIEMAPWHGKTYVIMGMALTLALHGKRVVIISQNQRKSEMALNNVCNIVASKCIHMDRIVVQKGNGVFKIANPNCGTGSIHFVAAEFLAATRGGQADAFLIDDAHLCDTRVFFEMIVPYMSITNACVLALGSKPGGPAAAVVDDSRLFNVLQNIEQNSGGVLKVHVQQLQNGQ